jgi:outer membrane protein OmpA-like peptidoglycan-associated protein
MLPSVEFKMMKSVGACSGKFVLISGLVLLAATAPAQQTTDEDIRRKEAELEKQQAELQRKNLELQRKALDLEKAKQELQYQETGQTLSMNLSGDVLFDYDKASLKAEAEEALNKVAVVLSQFPESKVTVEGFTDSKGSKSFNLELSRDRATAVRNWLVKNGGVNATNISATGRGEENPVAPNTNADGSDNVSGRAKNRRVSIIVEKPATSPPP